MFTFLPYSPMNKLLLASILAVMPVLAFADQGMSTSSTGTVMMSGSTGTGMVHSGMHMEHETKGLMLAIGALSPADRTILVKMIKDYLLSKGVDPAKYAEKREDIKDMKREMHDDAKEMRKDMHDKMKAMKKMTREDIQKRRDEMRAKMEGIRASGKVNVQDISMTK